MESPLEIHGYCDSLDCDGMSLLPDSLAELIPHVHVAPLYIASAADLSGVFIENVFDLRTALEHFATCFNSGIITAKKWNSAAAELMQELEQTIEHDPIIAAEYAEFVKQHGE